MDRAFAEFEKLADRKKVIAEAGPEALVSDELAQADEHLALDGLQVACGTMGLPTATVGLRGPDGHLQIDALGRVTVRIESGSPAARSTRRRSAS